MSRVKELTVGNFGTEFGQQQKNKIVKFETPQNKHKNKKLIINQRI
jgi:hypothetical protein